MILLKVSGVIIKFVFQVCEECGYQRVWHNQDMLGRNMPVCNLLLSGAIHFSGCMVSQTIRMLQLFGLQCISVSTYFRHQRLYTIPTIINAWQHQQKEIISQLKAMDGGLILSGDCRYDRISRYQNKMYVLVSVASMVIYSDPPLHQLISALCDLLCRSDSPGHCAKYGSYTVIEDRINKVLDLQLVQVGHRET